VCRPWRRSIRRIAWKERRGAGAAGFGALLLTPGPDLRYVLGYDAQQLERLTCLAVPAGKPPFLVSRGWNCRRRSRPGGPSRAGHFAWDETDDPYALVARRLGAVSSVGLSDRMWALMTLRLRAALPDARQGLASTACAACASARLPPR